MNENTYTVTLADGTTIENLILNGNNFVSDGEITAEMFADNLSPVTISDGENEEIHENMALVQISQIDGKNAFILRDISEDEIERIEAQKIIAKQRSELMETLKAAYKQACVGGKVEDAAVLARKIRNKLLSESDKEMTLDRLGLDTSSATKFIASLAKTFKGDWAKYRQALRDLPQQEGFPFNVVFPTAPDENEE